ncbi:MAG: A/G-specific adenine glycosylase [Acidobacteriota bacterium]
MTSFQRRLLSWYRRHRRVLPWREQVGPYRVWVSELMLQQTQVKTVVPYFERFVERFPDVHALAAADEQDVLAMWSGLGYYRRAKALHRAARQIVRGGRGRFPETLEGWLALPGVGRYTAGAILSIAFGKRLPVLDGNVARVLSRVFLLRGERAMLWKKAEELVPQSAVSEFNQALMELGALVCTPRKPRCLVCPVRNLCAARQRGLQESLPERLPRRPSVAVALAAAVVEQRGKVLLYRRQEEELMRDLWELPGGSCGPDEAPRLAVAREARERYGVDVEPLEELARIRHSIMNRKIVLHAFEARLRGGAGGNGPPYAWVGPKQLSAYPVSSMTLKVLAWLDRSR